MRGSVSEGDVDVVIGLQDGDGNSDSRGAIGREGIRSIVILIVIDVIIIDVKVINVVGVVVVVVISS